jgi:radical SAM/Cys-rich protein
MQSTIELLEDTDFPDLSRVVLTTLQVNLGYLCNQSCVHCHVAAGPHRTEMMSHELIKLIPEILVARRIKILDLTGGAPEMHPNFRELVSAARALGVTVIDRCNLTILTETGYESLAIFLADHQVEVTASLPCYTAENVDKQRGKGVFGQSIQALHMLNELGYGKPDSDLILNLVYNPLGASLPPDQHSLQARYKEELHDHFGIVFNQLFTLTNMPIQRFGAILLAKNQFHEYMNLLKHSYKPDNLDGVMCRSTMSVDWQGNLYDCDFNQQLEFSTPDSHLRHLSDLLTIDPQNYAIRIADHCYGCTAGQGSSCGGALNN